MGSFIPFIVKHIPNFYYRLNGYFCKCISAYNVFIYVIQNIINLSSDIIMLSGCLETWFCCMFCASNMLDICFKTNLTGYRIVIVQYHSQKRMQMLWHKPVNKWAALSEHVSSGICGERKLRSACTSAQSDQDIRCPLTEAFDITKCMNEEQILMLWWYFTHAQDDLNMRNFLHMFEGMCSLDAGQIMLDMAGF